MAGRQPRGCHVAISMFLDQATHRRLGDKLHDLFLAARPARAEPPALAGVDHDPAARRGRSPGAVWTTIPPQGGSA
jgi:hypothetical protein